MGRYLTGGAALTWLAIGILAGGCSDAVEKLKSPDRKVVIEAIREIASWDSASAAATLTDFGKTQADSVLAIEAVRGIGRIHRDEAAKALADFAAQGKHPAVRREAVTQMTYRKDEAFRKLFEQLARTDPDPQVRATAISAILHFRNLKDVPLFLELADQEQDDMVQARAVGAVEKLIQVRTAYNPTAPAQDRQRIIDRLRRGDPQTGRGSAVDMAAVIQEERNKASKGK